MPQWLRQSEFDPWDSQDGRREPIPAGGPQTSTCVLWYTCAPMHTQADIIRRKTKLIFLSSLPPPNIVRSFAQSL